MRRISQRRRLASEQPQLHQTVSSSLKMDFIKEESEERRIPEPWRVKDEQTEEPTGSMEVKEELVDDNHQLEDPLRVFSGQKILSCSESGKSLSQKRAQRTASFFFTCLECKMSFECKEHLMDHFRIHSGESCAESKTNLMQKAAPGTDCKLPFTCFQCQKSFECEEHLMDHYRIHTVDRPFLCDQCDKSFIHKQSLETHLRVHTGLRPHVCPLCGKCFGRLSSLLTHKKKHCPKLTEEKLL